jgi:hypothetical protein
MSVINKYILFVKYFYCKSALALCISFIHLLTHRNIKQTPSVWERLGQLKGGWDTVEDVTEAAFDWLGLKNSFCYYIA